MEHDAEEIWQSQHAAALPAISGADITAIGVINQRETSLQWDRDTGAPVYPAVVWQDRRTAKHCERLRAAGYGATVRRKTGLVIDPTSPARSWRGCSKCRTRP